VSDTRHRCPSALAFERYLLGELDGTARARFEEEIEACPDCAAALEELRADDAAFALRPAPAALRSFWTGEPPARGVPWLRVATAVAALAAAAVLVLALLPPRGEGEEAGGEVPAIGERGAAGTTRIMGDEATGGAEAAGPAGLALGFYLLDASGRPVLGGPGQVLREGDLIQFWYGGGAPGSAVLVGIDGRREVTRYFPVGGAPSSLPAAAGRLLDSAVQLDDARGAERFFLCVAPGLEADRVEAAAREVASSVADPALVERLPLDCEQATVWIVKE